MNLRGLRYFAAVAQARSFTKAAARLNVAQPAVSRQIQNLEADLGVDLLKRTRNGVELTGAGDFFLQRVMPLLVELDQAKDLLSHQSEAQVKDVAIGLTTGEGLAVAPMLIRRWAEMFPAAKLKIVEGLAPLIYSGLQNGSIDIGVAPEPLSFAGIWTRPLFEEPLVLIGPMNPVPPMPDIGSIDLTDIQALLRLPLIAPSSPNPLRGNIEALSQAYEVEANVAVELDSMAIIKDLVRRGVGCALTTYAHLANEIEHDMVRVLPVEAPGFWRNVSLFGLLRKDGSTPNDIAIDFIEGLIIDTVEAGLWPGARVLKKCGERSGTP
ncbi:LysR family transcriptional regulator [Pelagibius sp. Alg239-R121]|uniref:LysR family transcriptional regulator n=1 Tax=Pelagibius sp. Alg239-R121 TaxID=2993448 RepID=UPI0024A6D9D7|nr:LysR family transcriptional regulator [Pelagibius sp. Alg239-R121]